MSAFSTLPRGPQPSGPCSAILANPVAFPVSQMRAQTPGFKFRLSGSFSGRSGGRGVGRSGERQACTLVHELAHELLHQTPEGKTKFSRNEQELQAESVAYVVCQAVGLKAKSPAYLAVYKANKNRIVANLEIISATAKKILDEGEPKCTK